MVSMMTETAELTLVLGKGFRSGTGDWGLATGDWRLGTGGWGLATGDWRLGTGIDRSNWLLVMGYW